MGAIAAVFGLLYVAASALGAHALKDLSAQQLLWYDSACRMLAFHALALMLLSLQRRLRSALLLNWIALGFVTGTLLFCGALFALALGGSRAFAHLAPIGGILLMLSWLCWAWAWQRLR